MAARLFGAAVVAVMVSGAGCTRQPSTATVSLAQPIKPQCEPPSSVDFFFPLHTFAVSEYNGVETVREYSLFLAAMHEPSLSCGGTPDEAYRLLQTHPFRPDPLTIRVTRSGDRYSLVAVSTIGGSSDTPLALTNRVEKTITGDQWQMLLSALEAAPFWLRPAYHPQWPRNTGFEGDGWVLEGRRGGDYHVIARGATEEKRVVEVGQLLFTLAGPDLSRQHR